MYDTISYIKKRKREMYAMSNNSLKISFTGDICNNHMMDLGQDGLNDTLENGKNISWILIVWNELREKSLII